MECYRCSKDMTPPVGTSPLGLNLGLAYEVAVSINESEDKDEYRAYAKRQYGCYEAQVIRLCAECVLRMIGTVEQ